MTNQKLIQFGQVCALAIFVVLAVIGVITFNNSAQGSAQQNSNANSNTNTSRSENKNSSRDKNSNTGDSTNTAMSGQQGSTAKLSSGDKKFLTEAAMGGMMEVELGRWAAQQGTSDAIKQFGRKMVEDHSAANAELTQLASTKGISLPTALDAKHQAVISKMSKLTGAAFDGSYAKEMLSDHKKDVAAFERQSTKGADPDVKAFAAKTLPTLRQHLEMAKALPGNTTASQNSNQP